MSSPGLPSDSQSVGSSDMDPVIIYEPAGDVNWDDDDDMDFEPASESVDEPLGESDLDDTEFYDAEQGFGPIEIEFEISDDEDEGGDASVDTEREMNGDDGGDQSATPQQQQQQQQQQQPATTRRIALTQQQLLQLLGRGAFQSLFASHTASEQDDDDDDDDSYMGYTYSGLSSRNRRPKRDNSGYPKAPSEEGKKLMQSGTFGAEERRQDTISRKKKLAYRTMMREMGLGSVGKQRTSNNLIAQTLIPNSRADSIINYNARCYSGQFSDDGNFFFSCAQDFRVRMYDTSNPYRWKYYKTAHYLGGQWTITDATLSPDNRFLAYSSIRSAVCLSPTDPENTMDPTILEFASMVPGRANQYQYGHFGIWSLRYSGDGREIVAGTGDHSIYVYDIEARQSILRIPGHTDHVNAVCYGDKSSPHILYSGSDDTTIKVWDRRSMGDGREAGALLGHTEGLTYIDSKGDGRYILSNAKDQTMKLWDLRKMMTTDRFDKVRVDDYTTGFDYRYSPYDERDYEPHPHDCSVVTFRGHKVLKTLIRCHFSPAGSSDGKYVYSGSYDGCVYIWNLDATLAGKIDVLAATKNTRPLEDERYVNRWEMSSRSTQWHAIVRDASWHPNAPVIAATSWNGWDYGLGTCTTHSWNGDVSTTNPSPSSPSSSAPQVDADECDDPPLGARLTPQLEHDDHFYRTNDGDGGAGGGGRNISSFRRMRMRARGLA